MKKYNGRALLRKLEGVARVYMTKIHCTYTWDFQRINKILMIRQNINSFKIIYWYD